MFGGAQGAVPQNAYTNLPKFIVVLHKANDDQFETMLAIHTSCKRRSKRSDQLYPAAVLSAILISSQIAIWRRMPLTR